MRLIGAHIERGDHALLRWLAVVFALVLFLATQCSAQDVDSIYTLTVARSAISGYPATSPTPTQSFVVTQPPPFPPGAAALPPRGVLILLPGGDGDIHLVPDSATSPSKGKLSINSNNFLVRSRWLFAGRNFVVITLDAATDFLTVTPPPATTPPVLTGNQGNPAHIKDVLQVIGWARTNYPGLEVWLVGTSEGTAGAWVASLNPAPPSGAGPDGLVFASPLDIATTPVTVDSLQNPALNLGMVTVPTLILSNLSDGCPGSAPANDSTVAALFTSTTVTVSDTTTGGFFPMSLDPCDALTYHGFFGRERLAVSLITAWI